jgi:parallel beta-helix repeat protein
MKLFTLLSLSLCLFLNSIAAGTPGLNYNYYEGLWKTLPNFSSLTPVKKGVATNVSLDPRSKEMQYAFQWTGYINITATGNYTFETNSDDGSRLMIGSTVVVNNDGEHASQFVTGTIALKAGAYPITVTYFQSYGGQTMEMYWSSNVGLSRQKITDNVLTVNDPGAVAHASGLNYNYYEGLWNTLPNFSSLTPVKKGVAANVTLDPRVKDMQYAFQWTGFINIPAAGNYTFETNSDDGSRLMIGSTVVVNNDGEHASQFITGTIALKAGAYPITVTYFQSYGGQTMEMYWSSNVGLSRQKVADNVLNYYEGLWNTLPDFTTLTAVKKGSSANVTLDPRNKEMQYAFQWTGYINIPAAGTYTFETNSDDGSRLMIGTTVVVNNDGEHASQFVTGSMVMSAGYYPITITYFQSYGGQTMEVYWSSNAGISRQKITDNVFSLNNLSGANAPVVTTPVIVEPVAPVVVAPIITTVSNTPDLRGINNYYFSTAYGDDSRTAAQAQNSTTPWKTISKLNSMMSTLKQGDAVLFNRGETFTGSIIMNQSGTAGSPIIFSAYGTGNKPVITGFATLTSWNSVGNGAWEASLSSGSYLNMVTLNGNVQPMGRFPNLNSANKGYLSLESHAGNYQITDNQLGSSVNWTGAEVVIRKNDWVLDRGPITNHSGNTLTYVSPTAHQPIDGYGYFIQNSPLTLDQTGEWYYNPATKKLRMYFGSANPADYAVKASMVDTLVFVNSKNYVTFDNLGFYGADVAAFQVNNSSFIKVQNSDINYSGFEGVSADNSPYISINHSNNSGVKLYPGSSYASIKGNAVRNSGTIPGMGSSNNQQMVGLFIDASPSNNIELNTVDSSGYCGITFTGDYTTVKNNVINNFCLTVSDGGGIYTWGGWDKVGRKVTGNIILNGIGAFEGTNSTTPGGAVGIYTDDRSSHVDISNNSIANCVRSGIYLHNSHEMNVSGNTFYNNTTQLSMVHDPLEPDDPIRNVTTTGNVIASSKSNQFLVENSSTLNDIANFGSYNNNYYVRPTDQSGIITTTTQDNGLYTTAYFDLAGWNTQYNFDKQSANSPLKIPAYTVNKLIGTNKFFNGSFNNNIDGAFVMSAPGRGTGSFCSGGKLDGGAMQVTFDAAGGPSNNVGAYIDFGAVTAGKTYVVKFSLLSAAPGKTIKTFIMQNGGSYGKLSDLKYFNLSTTRTDNQFLFTAPSTLSNAMIAFEINGTDCPFWLDNLQIFEAEVATVNPDDYMRFEYNGTSNSKSVSLDGTYVDAKNKQYTGSISIDPFSSVILIKQTTLTTGTQAETQSTAALVATSEAIAQEATAIAVKVSPNPAHEKLQVAVSLPENTKAASMSLYTLAGVRLSTTPMYATDRIVPVEVASLNSGVYIININYDGHLITKKFVKQ